MLRERIFCRLVLVDIDPESRLLVRPHRAVPNLRAPWKDRLRPLRKEIRLLDAEVVAGQIELQIRRVRYRRGIARSMPGRAHAKVLTQRRQLPRRAQSADIGKMDPDEIDQPVLD